MAITRLASSPDPLAEFAQRGLRPSTWSSPPGFVFAPHDHPRDKRLYVLDGEISFNGDRLAAGEGVLISAGTRHEALAGPAGVTCAEAFEG